MTATEQMATLEAVAAPALSADPWPEMLTVTTTLSVEVPVMNMTVRELFRLDKGSIVASSKSSTSNVPLFVGKKMIAWGEFQVVGETLALRLAELA